MDDNKKPLKINLTSPAIATDGNGISIDDSGNTGLVFFQIVQRNDEEVIGNSVANVRLTFEQLNQLKKSIDIAIENHNTNKPKQK